MAASQDLPCFPLQNRPSCRLDLTQRRALTPLLGEPTLSTSHGLEGIPETSHAAQFAYFQSILIESDYIKYHL
jgi:hypothetical protein